MIMKYAPNHQNQLVLNLTFTDPSPVVLRVAEALRASADEQPDVKPPLPLAAERDSELQLRTLRKAINRAVGILALTQGSDFHTTWIEVYNRLHLETGYHATVESLKQGKTTHLDVIFEPDQVALGYPDKLMACVLNLTVEANKKRNAA